MAIDYRSPWSAKDYSADITAATNAVEQLNNILDSTAYKQEQAQKARLAGLEEEMSLRESMAERAASIEERLFNDLRRQRLDAEKEIADLAEKEISDNIKRRIAKESKNGKVSQARQEQIIAEEAAKRDDLAKKYEKITEKRKKKQLENEFKLINKLQSKNFGNSALGKIAGVFKAASDTEGKTDKNGNTIGSGKAMLMAVTSALSDYAKQLESKVDEVAGRKSKIDTALQGSKNKTRFGSYSDQMANDITGIVAVSPYIKQTEVYSNLETMVGSGIAYNVEQRAFLMTIKDKIAGTFNAMDGTLLRLVRVQQKDSTAARLGMESALTAFLNNMYETSEYMSDMASKVRSDLAEAEALMGVSGAAEFEYQVQKWAGSMYSVGMSESSVSSITGAIGKLAAGDVSALTDGSMGNLLVMAANSAGLSVGSILQQGLDADNTNKLMEAMVTYLADIASSSSDNRLVSQQLAKVYGVSASDLKAMANLADDQTMATLKNENKSYGGMLGRLSEMASTMYKRTSMGEMMNNVWDNFQYSMAAGMADNPVTYLTYKAASLLDSVAGGIAIPAISVMGSGVDMETTVADLMRVGAMSGGIISGIGSMITHLGAGAGFNGAGMIDAFTKNTSSSTVLRRGSWGGDAGANALTVGGGTVSSSGYIGNSSDMAQKKTFNDANDDANNKLVEAKQSEGNEVTNNVINGNIVEILSLLRAVTTGEMEFHTNSKNVWEFGS